MCVCVYMCVCSPRFVGSALIIIIIITITIIMIIIIIITIIIIIIGNKSRDPLSWSKNQHDS